MILPLRLSGLDDEPVAGRGVVGQGADRALAVHEPEVYLDAIAGEGLRVDVWQTTYWHVLPGNDAVLDWTRGTALRPVLAALNECDQVEFVERYRELLRLAYPNVRTAPSSPSGASSSLLSNGAEAGGVELPGPARRSS